MGVGFLCELARACCCSLRSEVGRETGESEERAGLSRREIGEGGAGGGSIDKGRSGSEMYL